MRSWPARARGRLAAWMAVMLRYSSCSRVASRPAERGRLAKDRSAGAFSSASGEVGASLMGCFSSGAGPWGPACAGAGRGGVCLPQAWAWASAGSWRRPCRLPGGPGWQALMSSVATATAACSPSGLKVDRLSLTRNRRSSASPFFGRLLTISSAAGLRRKPPSSARTRPMPERRAKASLSLASVGMLPCRKSMAAMISSSSAGRRLEERPVARIRRASTSWILYIGKPLRSGGETPAGAGNDPERRQKKAERRRRGASSR